MSANRLYWTYQILGWGIYSAGGFAVASYFAGVNAGIAIGFALFFVYSIGFTHLLRSQIKRRGWLALPMSQGLPRIFGAAMFVAAAETALVVLLAWLLTGTRFDAVSSLSTAGGIAAITCIWTAIYLGVQWDRRYRQSRLKAVQLELTLRQAELRALQAQVNPHFLFNSLNTIRGMIDENPQRAQHMITSLAHLFRRSLESSGAQMVPLAEEMEAVAEYLDLEATRFEERLRVSLEVDEAARQCSVPAMLVQTLVENAVKHGIAKLPGGGVVRVSGVREPGSLVLKVENSGKISAPDPDGTHTGLMNARQRLRLFYGEAATLDLDGVNGTVTATAVIPQKA